MVTTTTPTIMTVAEESVNYLFQGKVAHKVPHIINGKGLTISVADPKTGETSVLIDAMTGAAVGALGWGDEDVAKFYEEGLKQSAYSFPLTMCNENAQALAKFYIDNSPKDAFAAALWCGSGSEANENGMKIAYQYHKEKGNTKKTKFLSRENSYHGYTIGAMSLSHGSRTTPFKSIIVADEKTPKLPVMYPYRYQKEDETLEEYGDRLLEAYEKKILEEDPDTIIAIVLETLPGSSLGTVVPPPNYYKGIRKLCDKYDILLWLDEVMCGTGRCNPNGKLNCWENFLDDNEGPDIQTVGKTLGSGYVTIAGVLVSPKVKNTYIEGSGTIIGAQTYASHWLNCYVARKIQEKILATGLTKNVFEKGNLIGKKLTKLLESSPIVGEVRGLGGFWSVELVKNKVTKEPFDPKMDVGHALTDICFKNGVTVMGLGGCNGVNGDHISVAPNFTITDDDVSEIVTRITKSVEEYVEILTAEGAI
ncbi:uncharacterized protein KQ657_004824 [Scheffersomyces spartinae]|uniref:Aminotransferase n=1 Tax=Scheffersomyces spartinae TaxID=45513 RepID=A0A9P8AIV0_9ASCO|nr:uncharacterized protein KQ657_004824 [Scheffersomyces spartinae]KAG7194116.1 hypothetical protein KQ657_004824 [Scheffersomyces spartinae]